MTETLMQGDCLELSKELKKLSYLLFTQVYEVKPVD